MDDNDTDDDRQQRAAAALAAALRSRNLAADGASTASVAAALQRKGAEQ